MGKVFFFFFFFCDVDFWLIMIFFLFFFNRKQPRAHSYDDLSSLPSGVVPLAMRNRGSSSGLGRA